MWITRGSGTEMYRGTPRDTLMEAYRVAKRWLTKNPDIEDTTDYLPEEITTNRLDIAPTTHHEIEGVALERERVMFRVVDTGRGLSVSASLVDAAPPGGGRTPREAMTSLALRLREIADQITKQAETL